MIIPVFIICGIFTLIGGWVLRATKEDVQTAKASKLWPFVFGRIIDVDVHKQRTKSTSSKQQYVYKIRVRYEYIVDGVKYTSNKLNLSQVATSNKRKVDAHALELINKDSIKIFYNPENPEFAILETGISSGIKFMLFCGVTFFLAGIIPPLLIILNQINT